MQDIIDDIERSKDISFEESFNIASLVSRMMIDKQTDSQALARKITIHILHNWNKISQETYPIWIDIIESLGFYPYLQKESLEVESFSDIVRKEYFASNHLENTFLHKEQKSLLDLIISKKNVVVSAPTSFGKSLLIEEVIASQRYKNIVIIQPTLALIDETRKKLKKYSYSYKIIVKTSQKFSEEKGNIFLLTAERVLEYESFPEIELLIIDEFYKLSLRRTDDRADSLNNAFLKIMGKNNSNFYLLGPNIDRITDEFIQKYNAEFIKSQFSMVDCNVKELYSKINWNQSKNKIDQEKMKQLYPLLENLKNEQTLIYCSSPARARRFARGYVDYLKEKEYMGEYKLPLIEWINSNISPRWSLREELEFGVAIHDGSLQKHIGSSIIRYFNDNRINCIFCTSTIIEGVNTSAKNVVILDDKKGDKDIDFFDYSNIRGRAGRMMKHYVGNVYSFAHIPQKQTVSIDIPFCEQDPNLITDEILINIPSNDIKIGVKDRFTRLNQINTLLLDIIKKNGVSVQGQLKIYCKLKADILTKRKSISWTNMPTTEQLKYVLELAEGELFDFSSKHGVYSLAQLMVYLNNYRMNKNITVIISMIYESKKNRVKNLTNDREQKYYDAAIEEGFHIFRHWFQYTIPKVIRVVDSLQRLVCETMGVAPGSYSYFVQQLENDFIRENLVILAELGLPTNTVRKLEKLVPEYLTEDEVIEFIRNKYTMIIDNLLVYEKDKINECI